MWLPLEEHGLSVALYPGEKPRWEDNIYEKQDISAWAQCSSEKVTHFPDCRFFLQGSAQLVENYHLLQHNISIVGKKLHCKAQITSEVADSVKKFFLGDLIIKFI